MFFVLSTKEHFYFGILYCLLSFFIKKDWGIESSLFHSNRGNSFSKIFTQNQNTNVYEYCPGSLYVELSSSPFPIFFEAGVCLWLDRVPNNSSSISFSLKYFKWLYFHGNVFGFSSIWVNNDSWFILHLNS